MPIRRQLWARQWKLFVVIAAIAATFTPATVSAQERGSFLVDTFKGVILDPTTYAPSVIAFDATMRDWNSSQPFFHHGYVERNQRFTRSGLPNDLPVSYTAGRRLILSDALLNLEISVMNNVTNRVVEQMLMRRFPNHPRLVRTLGWVERIGFASAWSYHLSASHYRQAAANERAARQMGFK